MLVHVGAVRSRPRRRRRNQVIQNGFKEREGFSGREGGCSAASHITTAAGAAGIVAWQVQLGGATEGVIGAPFLAAASHELVQETALDAAAEGFAVGVVGGDVEGPEAEGAEVEGLDLRAAITAAAGNSGVRSWEGAATHCVTADAWRRFGNAIAVVDAEMGFQITEADDFVAEVAFGGSGAVGEFVRGQT